MRLKQSLLLLLVALAPGVVNALGLGKIQADSALNEPFEARIELLSATVEELDSLKILLADDAAFNRAGILRSSILRELRFVVKESETGPDYIRVYSNEPIREPFLNFLIEISWSKGRLYREYTVLLDPPIYAGPRAQKKLAQPAAPDTSTSGTIVREIEDNKVVYNPDYKPSRSTTGPAVSTTPVVSPQINYTGGDYGPVVSGDTLWSIAKAMRPDNSVSVQQMMLALLRANPEAFINNNINGLKRGHVLQMPDMSDIQSVSKDNAFAESKLQNEMWQEARGALATTVTPRPETAVAPPEEPAVPVEPEETVTEPEPTPAPAVVEEEGQPELRLVAPAEEGEVAGQDGEQTSEALTQELALANETLEALKLENVELRDKLSETEVIIDDLKRLIVLKENELAALQQQIADQQAAQAAAAEQMQAEAESAEMPVEEAPVEELTEEEVVAEETMPEESVGEEEPVEAVEEAEEAVAEEAPAEETMPETAATGILPAGLMGMVDQFKNNLPYSAAIPLGVVFLILIAIMAVQRRRSAAAIEIPQSAFPEFDDVDATAEPAAEDATDINPALAESESEAETALPVSEAETEAPAAEDKTQLVSPPAAKAAEAEPEPDAFDITPEEEEDPLAEVNVFLAYEHFDQAEEFVKKAIAKDPDNLEFHNKLLEVYYAANNKKGYEEAARVLHDKVNGQGDYWNMAVAMWNEISPNRALFEEPTGEEEEAGETTTTGGGIVNIAGDESGSAGGLDFDLDTTAGTDEEVLDVTSTDEPDVLDVTAAVDMGEEESLDVTAGAEGVAEEESVSAKDDNALDFEFDMETPAEAEEEETAAGSDDVLDISLDATSAAPAEEDNALDISLDVPEAASEEVESSDEILDLTSAADEEDKEDNSLDFALDMEAPASTEEAAPDEEEALDLSFDTGSETASEDNALDISLDVPEAASEEEAESTGAGDGSLDFAIDMETPAEEKPAEDLTEESKAGADLLDVTSALSLDEEEDGEKPDDDLLNVSSAGKAGEDLLDVTSASNFDLDSDEDLLDVTTSATGAGMDAEELLADDSKDDQGAEEKSELDAGDMDSVSDSIESDGLDFELSPDEGAEGEQEVEFDGIDITAGGGDAAQDIDFNIESGTEEDALEMDMDSTMQIPLKRSSLKSEEELSVEDFSVEEPAADSNFDLVIDEDDDDSDHTIMVPRSGSTEQSADDEIATQLDLAKAYVELGDKDNARTILDEIIAIGNAEQKQQAQELLNQI